MGCQGISRTIIEWLQKILKDVLHHNQGLVNVSELVPGHLPKDMAPHKGIQLTKSAVIAHTCSLASTLLAAFRLVE